MRRLFVLSLSIVGCAALLSALVAACVHLGSSNVRATQGSSFSEHRPFRVPTVHLGRDLTSMAHPLQVAAIDIIPPPHPLAGMSDRALAALIEKDPSGLGTASIGEPNRGALFNGVQVTSNELWEVVDPDRSWSTPVTVAVLQRAVSAVHLEFPNTPRLHLGDLSRKGGGYLRPHRSHQSGLDADLGYYYSTGQLYYLKATEENLDSARSWALVRALVSDPAVEYVFIDYRVQLLLRARAEQIGEEPAWLDQVFGGMNQRTQAPVRHTWGHSTHLHVRVQDPVAQETARRAYSILRRRRLVR